MRRLSPWIACALVALFALPALATGKSDTSSTDAAVLVYDDGFQDAAGGTDDTVVDITPGGKVTFGYPSGSGTHDVVWAGSASPSSCAPPLPTAPAGPGWSGTCTFDDAGQYRFFCEAHPYMTGTVNVTGTASPSPSPSPSASPSPSPSPSASPSPSPSPTATPTGPRFEGKDVTANDPKWQDSRGNTTDPTETINAGEKVTFAYPSGSQFHDVAFKTGPSPSSCVLTKMSSAPNTNPAPPLPDYVSQSGWEGYCTFTNPGTYTFVCDAHSGMTGKVIVQGTATPTATATASATATQTATATATSTATATATAPPVVVLPAATPTPLPTVQRAAANPKLAATFTRRTRTLAFTGTIAPKSGTVKIAVSYKVGKKTIKKTVSAKIVKGKFSAKLKLSSSKPAKLTTTLTYAGDSGFLPATKKATPKIKK